MEKVKVATIQCWSDIGEIEKNITNIIPLCTEAASNGAKFIILPETAISGYLGQDLRTNWCKKRKTIGTTLHYPLGPLPLCTNVSWLYY
jgi:predicted amidohydrolase